MGRAGATGPQGRSGNPGAPGPLGDLNCSMRQIAQWNGFQWVCADAKQTIATEQSCFYDSGSLIELNDALTSHNWISKCGGVGSLSNGTTTFSNLYLESLLYGFSANTGAVTTSDIFQFIGISNAFDSNVVTVKISPLVINFEGTGELRFIRSIQPVTVSLKSGPFPGNQGHTDAYLWWLDASQGRLLSRDFSLRSSRHRSGRDYEFRNCLPVSWSENSLIESLVVQCDLASIAGESQKEMATLLNNVLSARSFDYSVNLAMDVYDEFNRITGKYTYSGIVPVGYVFPEFSRDLLVQAKENFIINPASMTLE